jgi:O-acetyl-ADP-ribose deacetylase (regulator of RNase III)
VTLGSWERGWVVPSRDLLNDLLESCFYHADTLGVRSLALPLLGTGAAQFSPAVCLDTMFRFLSRKLTHGTTSVQEARVILHHPSLWRDRRQVSQPPAQWWAFWRRGAEPGDRMKPH